MNENKRDIRQELMSMTFDDYLFCTVGLHSGLYRVLNYYPDVYVAVITDNGYTFMRVPLIDITSIKRGCCGCDVVQGRTEKSSVPNIMSQAELRISQGHNYCFNCGRKLK